MNFEDILNQWQKQKGNITFTDKDELAENKAQREMLRKPQGAKKLPIEATIDLHGLTRDEAWSRLEHFIADCKRRNLKKVLIIHGKGNHSNNEPVLLYAVRTFINSDRRLGASGHPGIENGGSGATWVIIK